MQTDFLNEKAFKNSNHLHTEKLALEKTVSAHSFSI